MNTTSQTSVDLVEELRLRRWARLHHVPAGERDQCWHPVILEEMSHKDRELAEQIRDRSAGPYVPLGRPDLHAPHAMKAPRFLAAPIHGSELHYT